MKTGFREHLLSSLILCTAALFSLNLNSNPLYLPASFLFVFGSLLPDIDHPKSIPRKIMRGVLFLLLFFASLIAISHLFPPSGPVNIFVLYPSTALLLSLVLTSLLEFLIPKHRGKIHSSEAALFLGLFVFVLCALILPVLESLLLGSAGCAGYLLHLLVDFLGDRV